MKIPISGFPYISKVKNMNRFLFPDINLMQTYANGFQTPDALFFTVFSYFICGANSKNKAL